MILFIVEGERREPRLVETILNAFPAIKRGEDHYVYSFGTDIYGLYKRIKELGEYADIVALLKEIKKDRADDPIHAIEQSANIGQIYLIFDYDFQKEEGGQFVPIDKLNQMVGELLDYFNDETDASRGKLYISYPMVEALFHTELRKDYTKIDSKFLQLEVKREDAKGKIYKSMVNMQLLEALSPANHHGPNMSLWKLIIEQNLIKANLLCLKRQEFPNNKADVSQARIFQNQVNRFVIPKNSVAVLSAFPLFLFEYFNEDAFNKILSTN